MSVLYHGQTLMVQKLTASRFGKTKFGFAIDIRGDLKNKQSTESLLREFVTEKFPFKSKILLFLQKQSSKKVRNSGLNPKFG